MREYDRARRGVPGMPSAVTVAHNVGGWATAQLLVAQNLTRAPGEKNTQAGQR
jgi:hypothetical protein